MPWSAARPMSGFPKAPRLDEEVELYEFPRNRFVQVRYLGPFISYARAWIRIKSSKGGYVRIPKICLDYNPKTQEFDRDICPYRKAGIYIPQRYVSNMIVRDLQDDKPRRPRPPTNRERRRRRMLGEMWRIKDINSRTYTPVRCHDMPAGVAEKLKNLSELNTRRRNGKKIAYDVSDPRYGMDVLIKFNPKAKGAAMWEVQRAEPTRLTREEMDYVIYNLENLEALKPETPRMARREWRKLEKIYRPEKQQGDDRGRGGRDRDRNRNQNRDRDNDNNRNRNRGRNRRDDDFDDYRSNRSASRGGNRRGNRERDRDNSRDRNARSRRASRRSYQLDDLDDLD